MQPVTYLLQGHQGREKRKVIPCLELKAYIIKASKIHHGPTRQQVQELLYQMAAKIVIW